MLHLRLLAAALLLSLVAVPVVRAEIPLDDEQRVRLFGDLRLRYEKDWDSANDSGGRRDDRDRARIRVRLGFLWDPVEHLRFGIRGRTGNTDNQQSPHVTIWQDEGSKGDRDVLIDRWWVEGRWEHGSVQAGRIAHPFWRQTEMLFDDDIWLNGLGFKTSFGGDSAKHELRGAVATVPEGPASLDWDDQGWLYGLQYVFTRPLGDGRSFTAALAGIRIEDESTRANPVLLDLDWTIWALSLQGKLKAGELPVTLGAELFYNSDGPPKGTWNEDERNAWGLFVRFGGLSSKGDWVAGLHYARVEQLAYVPYLAGDDWMRWGSSTQTRATNYDGVELRGGYAFTDELNVLVRLFLVEGLELQGPASTTKEDGNRFRVDLNWKF